jgi:hypothetical protein
VKRVLLIITVSFVVFSGCGLLGKKKNFEDTDTYRELINNQQKTDKKLDSMRNAELRKSLDSLLKVNDSLGREVDKSMQKIKKDQEEFNRKLNNNK